MCMSICIYIYICRSIETGVMWMRVERIRGRFVVVVIQAPRKFTVKAGLEGV